MEMLKILASVFATAGLASFKSLDRADTVWAWGLGNVEFG